MWEDFHLAFATQIREALAAQVRPNFIVKLEERVFIHEPSAKERSKFLGKPDIALFQASSTPQPSVAMGEQVATEVKPLLLTIPEIYVERHAFIEIRDRQDRQLVTMIEVLSPTNKNYGPDREQYLLKRQSATYSAASIVEIDLLRGGPRLPVNDMPACDYCVTVHRKLKAPLVEFWPIGLRESLPVIPIPLKGEFADAKLDLKALLDRVYDAAGYEDYLYESPPDPALGESDAIWAQSFIAG